MMIMSKKTTCLIEGQDFDESESGLVIKFLYDSICRMVDDGYPNFMVMCDSKFNILAAEIVLLVKYTYYSNLCLIVTGLKRSYPWYCEKRIKSILMCADAIYISNNPISLMANKSSRCINYYCGSSKLTKAILGYIARRGVNTSFNIAEDIAVYKERQANVSSNIEK